MKSLIGWLVAIALCASVILFIPPVQHHVGAALRAVLKSSSPKVNENIFATPQVSGSNPDIVQAVQNALETDPAFVRDDEFVWTIDSTKMSADGTQALVILALVDPSTNTRLPIEPLTAVAVMANPGSSSPEWQVFLPGEDNYITNLKALPPDLQDPSVVAQIAAVEGLSQQATQQATPQAGQISSTTVFGGYYLPWANGTTQNLSQGASHTTCQPGFCTYAYDFYNIQNPKFPIHAAKGGTVYGFYDSCPDIPEYQSPNLSCSNYIVLQDKSTVPTTYQIYLHISQNSVPSQFRNFGATVRQGEWIANADNTGASWGSHLHFMVVTSIYIGASPAGYPWGVSVDVTFKDVSINWDSSTGGGRPCTPTDVAYTASTGLGHCTQSSYTYTSGNVVIDPPTGELILPDDKQLLTQSTVTVGGSGSGKIQLARLSMMANYNGTWKDVGPSQTTSPFVYDLDLCGAGIPDGPFSLALNVWDASGNQTGPIGIRHLIKNVAACPNLAPPVPPAALCSDPSSTQVVLYSLPNFNGSCTTLNSGFDSSISSLITSVSSIKVGSGVKAILYYNKGNPISRRETFTGTDRNLADNLIGINMTTHVTVSFLNSGLEYPKLFNVVGPSGSAPTSADSLILAWGYGSGANSFQVHLYQGSSADCTNTSTYRSLDWQYATTGSIGNLPAGTYTWCVQGRFYFSGTTYTSIWSSPSTFTVSPGSLPADSARGLPLNESFENDANGWVATGLWHLSGDPVVAGNHVWSFNNALDYNASTPAIGDLTSPPIIIPSSGTQYLRFNYFYQTESNTPYWDQRWLQISVDGAAFQNLVQLSDDAMNTWLQSPFISLASYAGHTIRLRFHFDSVDLIKNANLSGWFIDNISINSTQPPSASTCGETTANNTPATAVAISIGQSISGSICPPGDLDYYKFSANKNDILVITARTASLTPSSPLDSQITLYLSPDLSSVVAETDNPSSGITNQDGNLLFIAPQTGTYYLRVKAYDGPGVGTPDYKYILAIAKDTVEPTITITNPAVGMGLLDIPQLLTATAVDNTGGSGLARVEFWWHSSNWSGSNWTLIGSDTDGSDGWQVPFDPSQLGTGDTIAIFAKAIDMAGNPAYSVNWNVTINPPLVLQNLAATTADTAFALSWSVGTTLANLDHFVVQFNQDQTGWQNWATLPPTARKVWFVGAFGHAYQFHLNAVDSGGNIIQTVQAQTSTAAGCQPDSYENGDNSLANPAQLTLATPQVHNFCSTGDVDWAIFNAEAGKEYLLIAMPSTGSPSGPSLSLYNSNGTILLKQSQAGDLGQGTAIVWTAPASGTYALKVQSINPAVAGTGVTYSLEVAINHPYYFPIIGN